MNQKDKYPEIKKLSPDFTFAQKREAEDALRRYVALVWRIYRRIRGKKTKT